MFSARTSAVGFNPNRTTLPLKSRPNWHTYSSSAFNTAVPPCGRASISSYFARAIPAMESKLSRCTGATLVTTAWFGSAMRASAADFAGVRHPHLNHGEIVFRLQRQQPERQAKMIIEISFGAMHAVLDREQMGHRFFGRGLAHRTGDGDGSLAPNFSDRRRQRLERDQSVVDGKQAGGVGIARQLPLSRPPRQSRPGSAPARRSRDRRGVRL